MCACVYRWWQLPYFWAGIKAYDLVSGSKLLKSSYLLSKTKALELFPMLKRDKLVGAIVYYDGETAISLVLLSGGALVGGLGRVIVCLPQSFQTIGTRNCFENYPVSPPGP